MRTLFMLLGIVALLAAILLLTGIVSIDQTRPGMVQAPQFRADVADVSVGTENKTVTVPTVDVRKPGQ